MLCFIEVFQRQRENIQRTMNEESESERVFRLSSDLEVQFFLRDYCFRKDPMICRQMIWFEKGFKEQ